MTTRQHRIIEILCLTSIIMLNLFSLCWGPPGPPPESTPVGNAEMSALTIIGVAGFGYWKMRK